MHLNHTEDLKHDSAFAQEANYKQVMDCGIC